MKHTRFVKSKDVFPYMVILGSSDDASKIVERFATEEAALKRGKSLQELGYMVSVAYEIAYSTN